MDQVIVQLLEYLRAMWRRRFVGLGVAWLVGIGGVMTLFSMPNQYEASTRIFVDTQSVLKPLMSGLAVQPNIEQQVVMLSRTLLGRPNVEKLVRMADLDLNLKTQEKRDSQVDRLIKDIQITGSSDNLYSIRYRDASPDRAKRVVDSLLSIFVESGLGSKRRDTEKAQLFIDEQIKDYETRLQEAERRLKDFKLRNLSSLGSTDALSAMGALEEQLSRTRLELRSAEESRDVLKRQLAGEEPVFLPDPSATRGAPGAGEPTTSEIDRRIESLKGNLDELLRKYTDQHPDVVGTRRIIAELEKQRQEQLEAFKKGLPTTARGDTRAVPNIDRNPVYQQLKLSLADAEANVAGLRARMVELEARYNHVKATAQLKPELEEEVVQLNRDYQVHKTNYEQLISRRESAQLTSQLEQSASVADFRIIDPPRVSPTPVAPNRLLMLPAVLALSIAAGAVGSLAYSQIFPTFHTTRAVRHITQRPVLGTIPLQEFPESKRRRRLSLVAFFGGIGGLLALYGSVFAALVLMARGA